MRHVNTDGRLELVSTQLDGTIVRIPLTLDLTDAVIQALLAESKSAYAADEF